MSQASDELGFGGLNETIQTNVGQFLPPEPISQGALEVKEEKKKKTKTILKPIEPPPAITAQQEIAPSILQNVRAPDQYVSEQLVKDEPPGGAPLAAAEIIEPPSRIPSELIQIEAKWKELKDAGIIISARTADGTRRPKEDLLSEINFISGNEAWKPITKPNKPGPKAKAGVATLITDD